MTSFVLFITFLNLCFGSGMHFGITLFQILHQHPRKHQKPFLLLLLLIRQIAIVRPRKHTVRHSRCSARTASLLRLLLHLRPIGHEGLRALWLLRLLLLLRCRRLSRTQMRRVGVLLGLLRFLSGGDVGMGLGGAGVIGSERTGRGGTHGRPGVGDGDGGDAVGWRGGALVVSSFGKGGRNTHNMLLLLRLTMRRRRHLRWMRLLLLLLLLWRRRPTTVRRMIRVHHGRNIIRISGTGLCPTTPRRDAR
mmetsp:Transcript_13761/g.29244  ORF Transcript_13761/g.29244 Transcript_13761/m.29244 type:complete len:249 (-) Transcript_13761:535-1281(-)